MSNINNNFDNGVVSPVKPRGKYYITTPIYYPSANLHVGHTYCTVMADAMARFKRLQGYDVRFLTGTDEHGQKIQQIAEKAGMKPIEYTDMIVEGIIKLWEKMEISYDDFIRTTEDRHVKRVQEIFKKLYEKGDIYKGEYEGMYCAPCEAFWTETQLNDGKCPDCGRDVTSEKEEAYFFKLSKYQDALEDLFVNNPAFLEPDARRNEMLSFVRQGLDDLCISRSSFDWGIPVPLDEKHRFLLSLHIPSPLFQDWCHHISDCIFRHISMRSKNLNILILHALYANTRWAREENAYRRPLRISPFYCLHL